MGRRILAFFLGFIFAFVLIFGAIAIAVFAIKVNQVAPGSDTYLGDLANMSVYNIGKSLYTLYGEKLGMQDENGNYFTLGQFCENYNIDLSKALGMDMPQEVLDIPAFEFFSEGGMDRAMKQIKVSALPAIVNLFGGTNEDGTSNGMFGESVLTELAKFSLYDMLSNEEVGFAGVLANVRFAEILPDAFPAEDSDNKLMWAVGQTKIGGLLSGMSGGESFMLQLKAGGSMETLGQMELAAVLGESQYVSAILGSDAKFADLIADDGSIRMDDIINGVSVGELLGCQKNEITNTDGYAAIEGQSPDAGTQVLSKTAGEGETAETLYVMSENGENWYEAELKCESADEGHVHSADCFKYAWYSTTECANTNPEHNHEADDLNKDGKWYARTDGLYAVLAGLSITDLTSGDTDALMDEIKTIKIGDVIDASSVNGIMSSFVELTIEELMNGAIDDMYLGTFFNFNRTAVTDLTGYNADDPLRVGKERDNNVLAYYVAVNGNDVALSLNKKEWYVGMKKCEETDPEHVHHENCYAYLWKDAEGAVAEGIQNKLASKQIADLQFLNDEVHNMTLADVFGKDSVPKMLQSIAEVKIGELSEHIDTIMLGTLLGYDGGLTCENVEPDHVHDHNCYVWYKCGNTAPGHEHVSDCIVVGMMAKLAYKTVGEMGSLDETIKTFTLTDVLGEDIPDMLKSLANTEIGNLNAAINDMYLGDFLEYTISYTCTNTDENHVHTAACDHVWLDKNGETVVGMMSKLADNKVSELGSLNETVKTFTLKDVLGDDVPDMLADVADTEVGKLGEAIEKIYLGSALGYKRKDMTNAEGYTVAIGDKQSDGKYLAYRLIQDDKLLDKYILREQGQNVWYEAVRTCKPHNGNHTAACLEYVWYEKDGVTPVEGIVKAFVNCKINGVGDKMRDVTLGEMGIGGNKILDALQDTKITDIGTEINDMEMGVVLGYVKEYTCTEVHDHLDTCAHVWKDEAIAGEDKTVKGLNAKIADKKIKNMTGGGLTDIATSLTIGELIDSGMMSIGGEENEYKLAIIYCGTASHSFEESGKTWKCTLGDYFAYCAAKKVVNPNATVPAKDYWLKCHGKSSDAELAASEITHRDAWKNMRLGDFIEKLLKAI